MRFLPVSTLCFWFRFGIDKGYSTFTGSFLSGVCSLTVSSYSGPSLQSYLTGDGYLELFRVGLGIGEWSLMLVWCDERTLAGDGIGDSSMTGVGCLYVWAVSGNELRLSVSSAGFSIILTGVMISKAGCGDNYRFGPIWMESSRFLTKFLDLGGSGTDNLRTYGVLTIGSKLIALGFLTAVTGLITVFLSSLIFKSANLTSTSFSLNLTSSSLTYPVSLVISSMHYLSSCLNFWVIYPFLNWVAST